MEQVVREPLWRSNYPYTLHLLFVPLTAEFNFTGYHSEFPKLHSKTFDIFHSGESISSKLSL